MRPPTLPQNAPSFKASNPYGILPSVRVATVTPDMVQRREVAGPSRVIFSESSTHKERDPPGRYPDTKGPPNLDDWEEGSGLRRSPLLVTVRDAYPPELSRFVI